MSIIQINPVTISDEQNTLSPARFRWLLAKNGWHIVWDAVEAWAESNNPEIFATLYAQRSAASYRLSVTLSFLGNPAITTIAAQVAPSVDLSEDTIRAAWAEAKQAVLEL